MFQEVDLDLPQTGQMCTPQLPEPKKIVFPTLNLALSSVSTSPSLKGTGQFHGAWTVARQPATPGHGQLPSFLRSPLPKISIPTNSRKQSQELRALISLTYHA